MSDGPWTLNFPRLSDVASQLNQEGVNFPLPLYMALQLDKARTLNFPLSDAASQLNRERGKSNVRRALGIEFPPASLAKKRKGQVQRLKGHGGLENSRLISAVAAGRRRFPSDLPRLGLAQISPIDWFDS